MNNLPLESSFGSGIPEIIEPIGSDDCTAISLIKVAYSQTKKTYDVATLWNTTPQTNGGANPVDTITTAIKNGLLNMNTGIYEIIWDRYFSADIGPNDSFTNTQVAMNSAQSSCMINGWWYENWNSLQPLEVMPQGDTVVSNHSFVFVDWQLVNGVTMAIIDAHQGYHLMMPQAVFNAEMDKAGCTALMPSNPAITMNRQVTLIQWINELFIKIQLLWNTQS